MCRRQLNTEVASNKLLELFKSLKNHKFIFVEPGGNFGDQLIYNGAYKLALLAGLEYEKISFESFKRTIFKESDVIYFHGGGGFVPWWSGTPIEGLKKTITMHAGITIVGPQSFSEDVSFLKKIFDFTSDKIICKECFIFTREITSFNNLKKVLPRQMVLDYDHDTALNLDEFDILKQRKVDNFVFYAIRNDKESSNDKSYFVSFPSLFFDPISYCRSFDDWVSVHSKAKKIITNRLHSSILGSILGKPTVLLPNSYHKNHSVWDFSLQQRKVKWMDALPSYEEIKLNPLLKKLQRKLTKSYKVQSCLRFIYGIG